MASSWIDHVKKVAKQKGIKYNEALKVAGASYKKKDKTEKYLQEAKGAWTNPSDWGYVPRKKFN